MTTPAVRETLRDAYFAAITLFEDGDINTVSPEQWAAAEHLRSTLGEEIPEEVCALVNCEGQSAWLYCGFHRLFGCAVAQILACDIAESVLSLCDPERREVVWFRDLLRVARSCARGEMSEDALTALKAGLEPSSLSSLSGRDYYSVFLGRSLDSILTSGGAITASVVEATADKERVWMLESTVGAAEHALRLAASESGDDPFEAEDEIRKAHIGLVTRHIRTGGAP